jgi:hypothetical protein
MKANTFIETIMTSVSLYEGKTGVLTRANNFLGAFGVVVVAVVVGFDEVIGTGN